GPPPSPPIRALPTTRLQSPLDKSWGRCQTCRALMSCSRIVISVTSPLVCVSAVRAQLPGIVEILAEHGIGLPPTGSCAEFSKVSPTSSRLEPPTDNLTHARGQRQA